MKKLKAFVYGGLLSYLRQRLVSIPEKVLQWKWDARVGPDHQIEGWLKTLVDWLKPLSLLTAREERLSFH